MWDHIEKQSSNPSPGITRRAWCFPRDCGLSLVILGLFLVLAVLQTLVGRHDHNEDREAVGQPSLTYSEYLRSGVCWETLSENWESEFLEMGCFVWLTSFLFQRGSPESNDPDAPEGADEVATTPQSPWPARQGGWIRALYGYSLSLALFGLFVVAFAVHAISGANEHNRQLLTRGKDPISVIEFLGTSSFWSQSLQNWQSEFLGIGTMIVLAIWLRQKGSPESKAVDSPHTAHE